MGLTIGFPSLSLSPSLTTTTIPFLVLSFSLTSSRNLSSENGTSGKYIKSGAYLPSLSARALAAVIQPAFLPDASTTTTWIGRLSTSKHSSLTLVAIYLAALPNPRLWSVIARSLSIVLGIPITYISLPSFLHASHSLPQVSMVPLPPLKSTYFIPCFKRMSIIFS